VLATVQGRYHHGVIELDELPPGLAEAPVIVTFLTKLPTRRKRPLGLAPDNGQTLPTEFYAPLPAEMVAAFSGESV